MEAPRRLRILMLGWEYPPRYVGGLGKASQGLAMALAALGAQVTFVLPAFERDLHDEALDVLSAQAWLAQHASLSTAPTPRPTWLEVSAQLRPYEQVRVSTDALRHDDALPPEQDSIYGGQLSEAVNRYTRQVLEMAATIVADVIHAHDWMTFPAALAAGERMGVPVFLHVHSTEHDRSGDAADAQIDAIERASLARADHVFAVSGYTRQVLIDHYGVAPERVSVIYNAPDDLPQAGPWKLPAGAPRVMFLGRLAWQKGPQHFLQAAAIVAKANSEARFIVCGQGEMLGELHVLAQQLQISERVQFTGFLDEDAVQRQLRRAYVLVVSSESEPFGLVALEALRAGTPVIVPRQSGVREVLGHALDVDVRDHAALAEQILSVLRFPPLARHLVEQGRAQLARLSWASSAQRVLEVYRIGGVFAEVDDVA